MNQEELNAIIEGKGEKMDICTSVPKALDDIRRKKGWKRSECLAFGIRQKMAKENLLEEYEQLRMRNQKMERLMFQYEVKITKLERALMQDREQVVRKK